VWCGDYGVQHEMVEALVELATMKRSLWLQDPDWSSDAQSLREHAIRTPWLVTNEFVWNHFKSLCLVDKCVSSLCHTTIFSPLSHSFRLSVYLLFQHLFHPFQCDSNLRATVIDHLSSVVLV